MPRFVANGPDIPERLLQAQEDGCVVFFCGAGISYPAGLPDFQGLVDRLFEKLGATRTPIEEQAYRNKQYDATLDLLERRYPGQRNAVRPALADVLRPKWRNKGATKTHEALLQLARDRNGKVRLVTTNFDRIFQRLILRHKPAIPSFAAPLLPIPKPSRWHGVVHLHGLLPDSPDQSALNRLVLTSGDFGLAYLTERWAARFVSDLFRNYTVCFVGYSINDPVLRYMMDALAADEMLGEKRPEAYALGNFHDGQYEQALIQWEAKGVTPLLYQVPAGTSDHTSLHNTLKEWAGTYRDGVRGKEMIVAQHATTPPLGPSRSDFAVGRVLWALTDGLAANHFADLNPVPPLKWLEPLDEPQFGHSDLPRFGIAANAEENDTLTFSFIRRPTPYHRAPLMTLVDTGSTASQWDDVMLHLARWLIRHLNDPELVLWLAKRGGQLHERFALLVGHRLEELDKLECDGKPEELARIRASAPNAIPLPMMRTLWRLLLTGRLKSHAHDFDLYGWMGRLRRHGLTPTLRLELREILAPRVALREPFRWHENRDEPGDPSRIEDLVEWEIVLSANHVHSALRDRSGNARWKEALPDLLTDFSTLLRDTLDLMRELGGIDDRNDSSYVHQPSISGHPQNKDFRDWTALIDLARDAWLATAESAPERARLVAESWWQVSYPLFKRLAFFAAAQGNAIPLRQALDWLLADANWWLWSVETAREAIRLLVAIAPRLDASTLAELEQAILNGPPRDNIEPERWTQRADREVWLRLAKAKAAGATLGEVAKARLVVIGAQYPQWELAADERDEFPFWMGEGNEWRKFVATPRRRRDVVNWLKQPPSADHWQEDDWRQRCRDNFATTACALYALTRAGVWPVDRWREALQAWSEEKLLKQSWRYMAPVLASAPTELLQALAHGISWWLRTVAKTFEVHETIFLSLCRRILEMAHQDGVDTDDPVMQAINHPVGQVTEALLRWWYRRSLADGQGLPEELKPIFTELCNTQIDKFRHGRVLLAAHIIALYRVDRDWSMANLLPLFDWQRSSTEASAAWEGFLWSPRLYRPLMEAIKGPFLDTAQHYESLGQHPEQYAALLTFAGLDRGDNFSFGELAIATGSLPAEGLRESAQALVRALEGAGEQRSDYWAHRVQPYLRSVWPQSRERITPEISESLALLCVAAQEAFPQALEMLRYWLQAPKYPNYVVHRLYEAKICGQFPDATLTFLNLVISDNAQWPPTHLKNCLEDIRTADPQLAPDGRFQKLTEYLRRHGQA